MNIDVPNESRSIPGGGTRIRLLRKEMNNEIEDILEDKCPAFSDRECEAYDIPACEVISSHTPSCPAGTWEALSWLDVDDVYDAYAQRLGRRVRRYLDQYHQNPSLKRKYDPRRSWFNSLFGVDIVDIWENRVFHISQILRALCPSFRVIRWPKNIHQSRRNFPEGKWCIATGGKCRCTKTPSSECWAGYWPVLGWLDEMECEHRVRQKQKEAEEEARRRRKRREVERVRNESGS